MDSDLGNVLSWKVGHEQRDDEMCEFKEGKL